MPPKTLLKNGIQIPTGGKRGDRKPLRVARDNAEGALTDGAGRSQDGNTFQGRSSSAREASHPFRLLLADRRIANRFIADRFLADRFLAAFQKDCCAN
jgi:hypothetical protein